MNIFLGLRQLAYQPASRLLDLAITLHRLLLVSFEPVPQAWARVHATTF